MLKGHIKMMLRTMVSSDSEVFGELQYLLDVNAEGVINVRKEVVEIYA